MTYESPSLIRDGLKGPRYHPASRCCDRAALVPEDRLAVSLAVRVTVHDTGDV